MHIDTSNPNDIKIGHIDYEQRLANRLRYQAHADLFVQELLKARDKFGPMASAHEGYAVILEELEELKAIVFQKQSERDYDKLRKETVQTGAMVLAFLLEIVETENRR